MSKLLQNCSPTSRSHTKITKNTPSYQNKEITRNVALYTLSSDHSLHLVNLEKSKRMSEDLSLLLGQFCRDGNLEEVTKIIEIDGICPNQISPLGPPLVLACYHNRKR